MLVLLSACLALAIQSKQPAEPLRGVWLTTTGNDALASKEKVAETMSRLRDIGFNTVYVECWKNGYTQFPSKTLQRAIGVDRHPALRPGRDLLSEANREAHRNKLRCIAWFEYGFMAAMQGTENELVRQHTEWMLRTREGELVSDQNPFIWMNPLRPECRRLLLGLIVEAVMNYDIDGIQLDDRIAWPTSMGYDDYTMRAYASEHGGRIPPQNERDPEWVAWRASKVTEFAKQLWDELRRVKSGLTVSISPAVYPWCLENYACDWPAWNRAGWMTDYVPQVYRPDSASFARDWRLQMKSAPNAGARLAAGIMLDQGDKLVPWEAVQANLQLVEASGAGHVLWFSRAVLGTYSSQLKAYYSRVRGRGRN